MSEQIFFDQYQTQELLETSALGTIYQGEDQETGQAVRISVFSPELVPATDFQERYRVISDALTRGDHPALIKPLIVGDQDGQVVVIQPQNEGQTLAGMLGGAANLPVNFILDFAQSVGATLEELHQTGNVHGGLRPETTWLASDGSVQLMNIGFAVALSLNTLLGEDSVSANPFNAPEIRSGGSFSIPTDFYALGAILYQALTGELPELEVTDPWPGSKVPGLPPELDELVANCLAPAPENRVQSAAEFLNGVEEVRKGMATGGQDTILGMEDALVGHTLGAYKLVERMGQGGMATVYKGYEAALDRYVAIKVLPQFFARDPNFMQRFRREAKAVAQLNHPSIVPIYSYGEESNITYIAMQYVPGGTLKQGRGQVYEPQEAIKLALPIVRSLSYAHSRGIVHRDIKPSNVLLSDEGWPLLADFGLAKMAEETGQLTGTGVGVGTPMYMSPEQGQGVGVDHRTDIYSMGIMLYEMLTGDVPFRADTPMAIVIKHMTAPMPMPREINPDIPEVLERIILKATAKNQADRYQTAEEMAIALEQAQLQLAAQPVGVLPAADDIQIPAVEKPKTVGTIPSWLKPAGISLGIFGGILLLGLILMWTFKICPGGFGDQLPWCPVMTDEIDVSTAAPEAVPVEDSAAELSPDQLCAAGETLLLDENFEVGYRGGWYFSDTNGNEIEPWLVVDDFTGNNVFQIDGHSWAQYPGFFAQNLTYQLRMRSAAEVDSTHINFRFSDAGRYYVAITSGEMGLYKDPGNIQLTSKDFGSIANWHDLKISNYDGTLLQKGC